MEKNKIEFDSKLNKEDLKVIYNTNTHFIKLTLSSVFLLYIL